MNETSTNRGFPTHDKKKFFKFQHKKSEKNHPITRWFFHLGFKFGLSPLYLLVRTHFESRLTCLFEVNYFLFQSHYMLRLHKLQHLKKCLL